MAYITLPPNLPGMHGLLSFRPAIAPALTALTQTLMRSNEGLSMGERELIGAFVSALNDCHICQNVHGAAAQCLLGKGAGFVQNIQQNYQNVDISAKMKALLGIAESVQKSGKLVTAEQVALTRAEGASDLEIHDTVLITGLFCLFNRYLDGLGVVSDDTQESFYERGKMIAEMGYTK
jgi:uncharacterized peroxidase-related enzyme